MFFENDKELAVLLVLDWVGNDILKIEELAGLKPLAMNFMFWDMDQYLISVRPEVPKGNIFIGN